MEKVYLVYESNFEDVARDCGEATELIGLYKDKEKAYEIAEKQIKKDLENGLYVLDIERDDIRRDNYVRLFYDHQENWDVYFEICISEMEVK